jgi:hypothetical protein
MNKTPHTIENVTYSARGRRWVFEAPNYSYSTNRMIGGRETADKIAKIINGGVKRTKGNGIDGLASANMNLVFHNAAVAVREPLTHVGFKTESMSA